jgi:hypothetical protein
VSLAMITGPAASMATGGQVSLAMDDKLMVDDGRQRILDPLDQRRGGFIDRAFVSAKQPVATSIAAPTRAGCDLVDC